MSDYPLTIVRHGDAGTVIAARFIGSATGGGRFVFLPRRHEHVPPVAHVSFAEALSFYAASEHGGGPTACKAIEAYTGKPYHGGELWEARAVTPSDWNAAEDEAGFGTDPCRAIEHLRKRNEERSKP